jgi:predicted PurR-regulated permease PerM
VSKNTHFSKTLLFLIGVAAMGIAVVAVQGYTWLVNSVLLGTIIAVVSLPLLRWLRRKGLPSWLALVLTLLVLLVLTIAFVLFMIASVGKLRQSIPTYADQAESLRATIESALVGLGIDPSASGEISDRVDPVQLLTLVLKFLDGAFEGGPNLVVVVLVLIFLLSGSSLLSTKIEELLRLGNDQLARVPAYIRDLQTYVSMTAQLAAITGVLATGWLLVLGVNFPILWGVVTFLLSFIPTVGLFFAMIPPFLLALLEFGWTKALLVIVGYLAADAVVENVIKPKYLGESLNMAPLVLILSVICWTAVLGPLGALLGVPLTMAIKELVLEADEDSQWVAELMSE